MTNLDALSVKPTDIRSLFQNYKVPDIYQHPASGFSSQDTTRPPWALYVDDIDLYYANNSKLSDILANRVNPNWYGQPPKDNTFWIAIDNLKQSTNAQEQLAFFHIFQNLFGSGNAHKFRFVEALHEVLNNPHPGWTAVKTQIKEILDIEAVAIGKRMPDTPDQASRREVLLLLGDERVALEDDEILRLQRDFQEWKLDREIPLEKVRTQLEEVAQTWRKAYSLTDETWGTIKSSVHLLHKYIEACARRQDFEAFSPARKRISPQSFYRIPQEEMNTEIAIRTGGDKFDSEGLHKEDYITYRTIRTKLAEIPQPRESKK